MDVVIIANFCMDFSEMDNGRFSYLANMLCENNDVEIVTSSFFHITKEQRGVIKGNPYKITLIDEPGYKKNVCFKRFYSHFIWGQNVREYLKNRKAPDVVYCAVPSLTAPFYAAKYCEKNNVKFIVDVQDLWPEGFQMVFHIPVVSNIILYPFKRRADCIYKAADEVVAVSKTYVDRVLSVNTKCKSGHAVFLGTELETFDRNAKKEVVLKKAADEIWLAYCGTLGSSYDLSNAIRAVAKLKIPNLKFIIMGDGPLMDKFVDLASQEKVNAVFTGRLDYDEMCSLLKACDIAINPITKGAAQSIINKHADYAMAGLPVINTQENKEYKELLEYYNCGINCEVGDVESIAVALQQLVESPDTRRVMGDGSRRMAEERFNRSSTYQDIAYIITEDVKKMEEI